MILSNLSALANNSLILKEIRIISFGEARSYPGCLDIKSNIVMSSPLRNFTLKEYWLNTSMSVLSLKMGGCLFALRICGSTELSMITVTFVFLNTCLKLCILTASPHNSSSLILYLIAAGGDFFE